MFIRMEKQPRTYTFVNRNGKTINKTRTASMAFFECDNCGSFFTRQAGKDIDTKRCNNNFSHYCRSCPSHALAAIKGQQTQRNNRKKNIGQRTLTDKGYVRVYVQDTHAYSLGYCGSIFEHTMVMENYLNRTIAKGEVVHHINGIKSDNATNNLDVMTVEEHNKCHGSGANKLLFELFKMDIIKYNRNTKQYEKNC